MAAAAAIEFFDAGFLYVYLVLFVLSRFFIVLFQLILLFLSVFVSSFPVFCCLLFLSFFISLIVLFRLRSLLFPFPQCLCLFFQLCVYI